MTDPDSVGSRSRTSHEEDLLSCAASLLPSGARHPTMNPAHAMVVGTAAGSRLKDVSGNEYIDYLLGSGPMLLGHAHPAVTEAVSERIRMGGSYLLVSEPTIELARKLVEHVPCAERVCLTSTGSEAVMHALRLARAFRGRDKVLKFEGGYHGQGDCVLMSNQWTLTPADFPTPVPNSLGIPHSAESEVLVAPFNDLAATTALIERWEDDLGAVIVEPMQRTIPPVAGFLEGLRDLTADRGIPLVFDEVVTGFRLGLGGGQAYYGVTPDLCALGKSISAGFPLAAVCGRGDILELAEGYRKLTGGYVSLTGTYSGNPVSCAAACAAIRVLEGEGVYDTLFATGNRLRIGLESLFADRGIPVRVSGEDPAFEVWFTDSDLMDFRSTLAADPALSARFASGLFERGVLKAHEKFFLSLAHTDEDVDLTLEACADAIAAL